jgi:hydroxymethylbilane synthase
MLPAVGQGAVAIEIREDDQRTARVVSKLNHQPTRICITAERAFLRRLEGGCQVPIGAHATLDGDNVTLEGMVGGLDGTVMFRERISGKADEADSLGTQLADDLIKLGARELLENTREQAAANTQITM